MIPQWTPMQWPDSWKDPATLDLVKGTAIDYLMVDGGEAFAAVRTRAEASGFHVGRPGVAPPGVLPIPGEWPGVKMAQGAGAESGPTGVPWVDSNGWAIRLAAAMHPETRVWVAAPPKEKTFITADSYLTAIADSAAHGGRWVISLDSQLAAALAAGKAEAQKPWKRIVQTSAFFAAHQEWSAYTPQAVAGIVSDFSGGNEFFSRELLNLAARAGLHYRILPKATVSDASFAGLRALIYSDAEPPSAALRQRVLGFVESGGMLITAPGWGNVPGTAGGGALEPRYAWRTLGKGKIAAAREAPDDPYLWANDAVVLVSHRYDLVRFWNGGATGSFYTLAPNRKQAVVHLLFYAGDGPDHASVRIAGNFREVRVATVDVPEVPKVQLERQKDALEVHLPQVSQYVAVQLES